MQKRENYIPLSAIAYATHLRLNMLAGLSLSATIGEFGDGGDFTSNPGTEVSTTIGEFGDGGDFTSNPGTEASTTIGEFGDGGEL